MRYVASILVFVVTTVQIISAQQPARYRYLAEAIDHIVAASETTAEPTAAAVEESAARGCKVLLRLLDDGSFRSDVEKLSKSPRYARERGELTRDLVLFTSAFMVWERKALQDAGLQTGSSERLLWAVASLRSAVTTDLRAEEVITGIKSLGTELCSAAKEAQVARTNADRRRMLSTWGMRIGGALVIAANGAFANPSGGFALASVGIGAALMNITFTR